MRNIHIRIYKIKIMSNEMKIKSKLIIFQNLISVNMKNYAILSSMLFFLCLSCANMEKNINSNGVKEINILDCLSTDNKEIVNLSSIALSIEYCMLETDENCLISDGAVFYSTKDKVVVIDNRGCYVFDRETGRFIRRIASRGQGPDEYVWAEKNFWDAENELVCFRGNNNYYLFYSIDGTLYNKVNRFSNSGDPLVLYEDVYVRYVPDIRGNATIRIAFYNKKGDLIDSIPNHRLFKRDLSGSSDPLSVTDSWLYVFCDTLCYRDLYCDTLYQIKDFKLYPRFIFNTGGLTVPYKMRDGRYDISAALEGGEVIDRYEKYVNISKLLEDNRYMYFTLDHRKAAYRIIYDKNEDDFHVISKIPNAMPSIRIDGISSTKGDQKRISHSKIDNDLDGGLPFWPDQMISEKEMMCVFSAEELLGLDTSKITDPKLKSLLNSLEEDSNPVVAIVTLKD